MTLTTALRLGLAVSQSLPLVAAAQPACDKPQLVRDATPAQVQRLFKAQKKTVLTFMGYSGAGFEDPGALLEAASRVLDKCAPSRTVVNIGATAAGIGAVYELAAQRGFATRGIVSTQTSANAVVLSPCVQQVFYVQGSAWGGALPGGQGLSPTSVAMVSADHAVVAIGGGEVTRDEFVAARRAAKKTRFIAADMNHQAAIDKAVKNGQPPPTDFLGALAPAL